MNILGRLLTGLALWVAVAAVAQKRPPNYSQESMPATSFSCRDKIIGGYYADPETDCQMFHVCVKVPGQGVQDYRFLCPNDTSFDQENQICDDWFNIDCEASTLYYSDNFDLYRIGGDIPRTNLEPRLPSNNINNAVSEIDDGFYLQKSDRGENVGSDLLRGSHSSNFFSNKNRGREDDDYSKDDHKKTRGGNVKKLLTGKRPLTATQAPVEESKVSQPQYRPKTHNFAGRVSQFQRTAQQQTTVTPVKITETHNNRQSYTQRNYYSPTTPKIETTSTAQRTEFFRNYNPTTKRSFYENTQNYNTQTTPSIQTTRNYQNFRTTTQAPTTVNYYETTLNYEKNNNYETQKLYKLNTGALNQYDDSKDEFLKTAPSLNLGASAFNSLQSSIKNINTNVSSVYNFNLGVKSTTDNYQSQTYFNPTTLTQNYYNPSTPKPYQQEYFTTAKPQVSDAYKQQFYNPQAQQSTTVKDNYQYSQTTQKPFQQQYTYSTESTYTQYNPTTLNPFNQQILSTKQPIQQYNNQAGQQYNQPIQPYNNQPSQQTYQTQKPPSQQLTYQTQKPSSQPETYTPQRNTPTQKPFQPQRNSPTQQSLQLLRDTPAQQSFQHPQISQNLQQQYQPQRSTKTQKLGSNTYYNPTTLKLSQTIKPTSPPRGTRPTTLDATEQPRPFTQDTPKKDQKKEKEQYDYAYYDDGTQAEYDNLEPVEDFSRTKSKN